jgi:hypothetical protein
MTEKVKEVIKTEHEKKEKMMTDTKDDPATTSDSTQCDVPKGCGTTGHIHVNGEPYHEPAKDKTSKDYPKSNNK